MSDMEGHSEYSGKKRKHEDEAGSQSSPAKKSKSAKRNDRRHEQLVKKGSRQTGQATKLGHRDADARRQAKREMRREKKQAASAEGTLIKRKKVVRAEGAVDYDVPGEQDERRRQKHKTKAKSEQRQVKDEKASKPAKQVQTKAPKWTVSDSTAGRYIDHDPVYVQHGDGEDYVITAVARELHVLSVQTSLLVRTLPAPKGATIVSFAVPSSESNLVYFADSRGSLSVWDWTNDQKAWSQVTATRNVKRIAAASLDNEEDEDCVPFLAYADGRDGIWIKDRAMYTTKKSLDLLQVLGRAEYIIAGGSDAVVIGSKKDSGDYTWAELPLSKSATCLDARVVLLSSTSKKASRRPTQLQLALGHEDGQIHFYDDVSSILSPTSQQKGLSSPRILHWHRSALSSIKFSPDGKYFISGGKETVLVLWQLETGKKQFLPHLTSEIERITVNSRGDRYALKMGDNSIMVLSTAELKPVANFAGIQLQTTIPQTKRPIAAVLHPKQPRHLLLTVPATLAKAVERGHQRPFMQTFDLRLARHITRQALTRNNATDLNVGPEENAILPPDVLHISISQDGQWLATVDEWMPPTSDLMHLKTKRKGNLDSRRSRCEVYLKIWHWDAIQEMWTLSTRADSPHARAEGQAMGAGRILALASDPGSNCFATVGEDRCVKLWKPKTRTRGGVAVNDAQGDELVDWTCRRSVQLPADQARADSPLDGPQNADCRAALAYSGDGSLLAVSTSSGALDESASAVTFIDTAAGTIAWINSTLSDGSAITSIAFLERYFISLTYEGAFVWDLVSDTFVEKINLSTKDDHEPLLVVSEADQMFAIVTAPEKGGEKARVEVHTTRHAHKIYMEEFNTEIVKILSGSGNRGFVLLFADATVRTLLPAGAASSMVVSKLAADSNALALVQPGAELEAKDGAPAGHSTSAAVKPAIPDERAFEIDEDDRPVVRPEQLASIFDVGQSFAMPPVRDMFQAVVGLFGRRPHQTAA